MTETCLSRWSMNSTPPHFSNPKCDEIISKFKWVPLDKTERWIMNERCVLTLYPIKANQHTRQLLLLKKGEDNDLFKSASSFQATRRLTLHFKLAHEYVPAFMFVLTQQNEHLLVLFPKNNPNNNVWNGQSAIQRTHQKLLANKKKKWVSDLRELMIHRSHLS